MTNNVFQTSFKMQTASSIKNSVYSAINTQKAQANSIFSSNLPKTSTTNNGYYKPLGSQNTQPYFSIMPQVKKGGMGFRKDIPQVQPKQPQQRQPQPQPFGPQPFGPQHNQNNIWGNNVNSNNMYSNNINSNNNIVYNNVNINVFNGYC